MHQHYTPIQQQMPQAQQGMQTSSMSSSMQRGGHEMFDVQEVLQWMTNTLEHYTIYRSYVRDQELLDMMDRQYQFLADQYNITCECFRTGSKPSHSTRVYKMTQNNNVVYGLQGGSTPMQPVQSARQIDEKCISSFMLGQMKSMATFMTTASLEATNPVVRRVLADSIPNVIEMAYEIFLYQNKQAYYQVPQLQQQDMQQIANGFAPLQQMQQPMNNMSGQRYQ